MTAPDGKTVLSASVNSPQVTFEKPTASWGVDPATIPISSGGTVTNTPIN